MCIQERQKKSTNDGEVKNLKNCVIRSDMIDEIAKNLFFKECFWWGQIMNYKVNHQRKCLKNQQDLAWEAMNDHNSLKVTIRFISDPGFSFT